MPDPARTGEKTIDDRPSFIVVVEKGDIGSIRAGITIDLQLDNRALPLPAAVDCVEDFAVVIGGPKVILISPGEPERSGRCRQWEWLFAED